MNASATQIRPTSAKTCLLRKFGVKPLKLEFEFASLEFAITLSLLKRLNIPEKVDESGNHDNQSCNHDNQLRTIIKLNFLLFLQCYIIKYSLELLNRINIEENSFTTCSVDLNLFRSTANNVNGSIFRHQHVVYRWNGPYIQLKFTQQRSNRYISTCFK